MPTKEPQGVSIQPSSFTNDRRERVRSTSGSDDLKITGRWSIHPFTRVLRVYAKGHGYNATMRGETKFAADAGWKDDRIVRLRELSEKIDDIALMADDFCIDSVAEQLNKFRPSEIDTIPINIRVWDRRTKDDLESQAMYCGLPTFIYVQLRIIERLLQANLRLGKSGECLGRSLDRFNQWMTFRETQLGFVVERYGDLHE